MDISGPLPADRHDIVGREGTHEPGPLLHHGSALLHQLAAAIGGFGFVADGMGEGPFGHVSRDVGLLRRPIPKGAAEAMRGRLPSGCKYTTKDAALFGTCHSTRHRGHGALVSVSPMGRLPYYLPCFARNEKRRHQECLRFSALTIWPCSLTASAPLPTKGASAGVTHVFYPPDLVPHITLMVNT